MDKKTVDRFCETYNNHKHKKGLNLETNLRIQKNLNFKEVKKFDNFLKSEQIERTGKKVEKLKNHEVLSKG